MLFSLHLKATMMKVSDPIIFGHAVEAFFPELFAEHGAALTAAGISANDGLANLLSAIEALPADQRAAIEAGIQKGIAEGPDRWPWSTPTRASPTCTCRATSSSTPRCPP